MAMSLCGKRVLLRKSTFLQAKRHGYIVLVPEIGEDLPEKNPLLRNDGLPEFNKLTIEKCVAAISQQALNYDSGLQKIEDSIDKIQNVFSDIFIPLEHLGSSVDMTWGVAKTLYLGNSSMMPTKSYLNIHERAHRCRSNKFNSVPIYNAVKKAKLNEKSLTEEESRLLDKYILEGTLNGVELQGQKRLELDYILHQLKKERDQFREKVAIATKQFNYTITDGNIVSDFPTNLLRAMASNADEPTKGPWTVTLQPYVFDGFMKHCPKKHLRWNAWQAYNRKCSGSEDKSLATSAHVEKIRSLREDQAKLIGFKTFADMSMKTKMAGSVDNVKQTVSSLLQRARPIQDVELENLETFAREEGLDTNLEECDIPYWKRRQQKSLFDFDEEDIREYFPLPVVLQGLFDLCSKLFDIRIVERPKVDAWHEDVKFYDIYDPDISSPIAGFYVDPYARENDKVRIADDSGWMLSMCNRSSVAATHPLAALIFNFQIPIYGKPSLLSFHDVKLLFNKFGHSLRHLLTEANYSDVAGLSNVEWDTVNVCGHVMTHLLYEPATLKAISSHYTTQEKLPDQIVSNIHNINKHLAGYELCKELYLSTMDIEMHSTNTFWRDLVKQHWPLYHTLPLDKKEAHVCSFSKIFSEEWAAAYYCNVWSRIIAADIYSAFYEVRHDENEILEVGRRYKDTFLSSGGSCHSSEVFRRFRGRDPSHKALLHTLGLAQPVSQRSGKSVTASST